MRCAPAPLLAFALVSVAGACSASLEVDLDADVPRPIGVPSLTLLDVHATSAVHVRSVPPGIDCGGTAVSCSAGFVAGSTVVLSTTSPGPALARWSAPCLGSGRDCTLTVDAHTTVDVEGLASGDTAWARLVGGPGFDQALSVAIGSAGTPIIAGAFVGTIEDLGLTSTGSSVDAFLAGVDARTGELRWGASGGGDGSDVALKVAASATRIAVAGSSSSALFGWGDRSQTQPAAGVDAFQVTLAADRESLFLQGGVGVGTDYALSTDLFPDGSVATAGVDGTHMFVRKTSSVDGSLVWDLADADYIPGAGGDEVATEVIVAPGGDVIVAGFFQGTLDIGGDSYDTGNRSVSDAFVMRLDGESGTFLWLTPIGGTGRETCNALALLSDGSIVTGGAAFEDFTFGVSPVSADAGGLDGWVAILSQAGTPVWATGFGGAGDEFASDVGIGLDGSIYVAGRGKDITFGPFSSTAFGGDDAYVAKLAPASPHSPVWLRVFGGPGDDQARDPTISPDGALYVTGSVEGTVNLGLGLSGSHGGRDAFLILLAP